jgi:hypothetical protein
VLAGEAHAPQQGSPQQGGRRLPHAHRPEGVITRGGPAALAALRAQPSRAILSAPKHCIALPPPTRRHRGLLAASGPRRAPRAPRGQGFQHAWRRCCA